MYDTTYTFKNIHVITLPASFWYKCSMLDHCYHIALFTPIMVHPLTVLDEDTSSEDCNEDALRLYSDIEKASNAQRLCSDMKINNASKAQQRTIQWYRDQECIDHSARTLQWYRDQDGIVCINSATLPWYREWECIKPIEFSATTIQWYQDRECFECSATSHQWYRELQ